MPLLNPPLTVRGSSILDASGSPVRLAGVNWSGAHQDHCVPAGLDKLRRSQIIDWIAYRFNHVRLTYALGAFVSNDGTLKTGPASPAQLAANPDLQGMSSWQVYCQVVADLTAAGVAVIPNCHLLYPGQCCSQDDCNGMWYNDSWPSSTFTNTWVMVAQQFAANPLVIGFDLKNEPRPATIGGVLVTPTWGDQSGFATTDFRLMYSNTAARIRAAAPGKLFFCEGLSYATDLTQAGTHPVSGGDIVYSLHDYSWFHPGNLTQAQYGQAMDARGGYLQAQGTAPVWVGEFGANTDSAATLTSGWLPLFLSWAQSRGVHWCWWQMSAETVLAHEPVTNKLKTVDGDRETYGLLSGQDWCGSQDRVIKLLQQLT